MPQQPAKRGISTGQAAGLAVFLVSAITLAAFFVTGLGSSLDSLQRTAVSLSTLSAAVAASAMLIDGVDLWVRGRKLSPYGVRIIRSLIFVAVLVALLTSLVGGNSLMVLILAPSMLVYVLMARRSPTGSSAAATARGGSRSGGAPASGSRTGNSTSKARQRKGGKKHR